MTVVVSDTSPIRALAQLNLIDLPWRLFSTVLIPPAVAAELSIVVPGLPRLDPATIPGV